MHSETDQRLWNDPLWRALENAITKLNVEGTKTLRRWTQESAAIEQINQLAMESGLTKLQVIEIEYQDGLGPEGWKHPDRWQIQFNHPRPLDPIVIHPHYFPPKQAQAALPEIANYLGAWQRARAEQLNVIEQTRQLSGSPAAASDVQAKPITVTVAVQRYAVSRSTLRRAVGKGALRDLRPPGSAENSPLLLDENQIACCWPTKG